jgi:hypothetical protein|tara:strand:- start:26459 stop:26695 length:237 start_codon:yes stop_codon:yes gene_type:complete
MSKYFKERMTFAKELHSARKVEVLLTLPVEEALAIATILEDLIKCASDEKVIEICNQALDSFDKGKVKVSEVEYEKTT